MLLSCVFNAMLPFYICIMMLDQVKLLGVSKTQHAVEKQDSLAIVSSRN